MKHDEHKDEQIFNDFYMFNNVEIDLQEEYFDEKLRNIVNNRFREMTLYRNSKLWQTLSIQKQYELKHISKFIVIEKKIEIMTLEIKIDFIVKNNRNALIT